MLDVSRRPVVLVLLGALAVLLAQGTGRFVLTPLLPAMQAELGLGDTAAGLLGSLNFAGYLAGALLVALRPGLTADRLVRVGLVLVVGGALAMPLLAAYPVWLAARSAAGLGGAFLFLGAVAATAGRLVELGRNAWAGAVLAGVGVGIALGGVVALLTAPGWRIGWLVMAAPALLAAPWLLRLAPIERVTMPSATFERTPELRRLAGAYGLSGVAFGAGATFFVRVLAAHDAELATWAWILAGLVAAPSVPLWNLAGRRLGRSRALAAACLLQALGVALAGFPVTAPATAAAGLLLGGTFMGVTTLALERARLLQPGAPAGAAAYVTVTFGLGQLSGPALSGLLLDYAGPTPALLVPALVGALGALLLRPDLGYRD